MSFTVAPHPAAKIQFMSFLDNLENNLKALESRDQGGIEDNNQREATKKRAQSEAPWAERLKKDPWTATLMQKATRAGFERRTKVHLIWAGTTLRLEAREQRLELRPAAGGILVVYQRDGETVKQETTDLSGDPDVLIAPWMRMVEERKKREEAEAAALAAELEADIAE